MTERSTPTRRRVAAEETEDLFRALYRLGVWRVHLVLSGPLLGRSRHLTLEGLQDAALRSPLDEVIVTFAPRPQPSIVIETKAEDDGTAVTTETEEP